MGFFDILSPFFEGIDTLLQTILSPTSRLVVWGIASSAFSMWLYVLLSSQKKLKRLGQEAAQSRKALAEYDGEFEGVLPLIRHSLSLSFQQIGLALMPALLASFPVLSLLVWLSGTYDYRLPDPNSIVNIRIFPAQAQVQWEPQAQKVAPANSWQISWPANDEKIRLRDASNRAIAVFPLSKPVPLLHKRQWWNLFFGNPIGYIPENSNLSKLEIMLPQNQYIKFGPQWMRSALAVFFLSVIIASIAIKFIFRIY